MTALRWALVVLTLQAVGVLHQVMDVVIETAHADSCDDGEGECPPLCADTTCPHGVRPAVETVPAVIPGDVATPWVVSFVAPAGAPESPFCDGVFHPPRA